jgi:glucose dehydrogenase
LVFSVWESIFDFGFWIFHFGYLILDFGLAIATTLLRQYLAEPADEEVDILALAAG